MLNSIMIISLCGWILGIFYDLLSPKVEDPRLHIFIATITILSWWESHLWLSCLVIVVTVLYAALAILHYIERWNHIGAPWAQYIKNKEGSSEIETTEAILEDANKQI